MEEIIRNMIKEADPHHDYVLAGMIHNLLSQFTLTWNCPSNWRDLGEILAEEYNGNDWVMDNCKLYEFI